MFLSSVLLRPSLTVVLFTLDSSSSSISIPTFLTTSVLTPTSNYRIEALYWEQGSIWSRLSQKFLPSVLDDIYSITPCGSNVCIQCKSFQIGNVSCSFPFPNAPGQETSFFPWVSRFMWHPFFLTHIPLPIIFTKKTPHPIVCRYTSSVS